jgi:hypothetical protein
LKKISDIEESRSKKTFNLPLIDSILMKSKEAISKKRKIGRNQAFGETNIGFRIQCCLQVKCTDRGKKKFSIKYFVAKG